MFKKILVLIALVSFTGGGVVLAGPDIGIGKAGEIAQQGGLSTVGVSDTTLSITIGNYIKLALSFTGFIFLILTLYAGYLWMFGGGNEANIDKAKKIFTSSVTGLILVVLSYSITALIMYFVAGTAKPKPYGEIRPEGPSEFAGCCYKANTAKCWNNRGKSDCDERGGVWYTQTCATLNAIADFNISCEEQY